MPFVILRYAAMTSIAVFFGISFVLFPDNSLPDKVAHILSDHVNDSFQAVAHLLMFWTAWSWRSWQPLLVDLAVVLPVTAIVQLSKRFLIADIAIRPSGGYEGFPSGHTTATFSLAFVLSLYYPRLWWVWYTVAALVTWSRIQTNAHTELQVAAGMLFGTLSAFFVARAMWKKKAAL